MKIDFSNQHLNIPECPYYKDIKVHTPKRKVHNFITPLGSFSQYFIITNKIGIPILEIKSIFKNIDKPMLYNSKYFKDLKVGIIPKYVGFKYETNYTST